MPFIPIKHDDLRIGLFVQLNGSWFSHPFSSNTVKIKSNKDLVTLKGLRKVEILFDPDRSDPENSEPVHQEPTDIQESQPSDSVETEDLAETENLAETVEDFLPSAQNLPPVQVFHQHCERFKKSHEAYQTAFKQSKAALHDITAGNFEGMEKAKTMIDKLEGLLKNMDDITALINVMNANDMADGMFSHAINVCILSIILGREFDLTDDEIFMLGMGALFHDIGELNVPGKILLRRSNLNQTEREVFRQHPGFGKDMIKKFSGFPKPSLDVIYHHHERLDGSGYPMGLKGKEAISLFSKIVMVVDRYDELCHDPDPEKRLTPSEALSHLFLKQKTVLWNDAIVALIRMLGVYPPGSLVQLSDGSLGMVVNINVRSKLRPLILLYQENSPTEEVIVLDLEQHEELMIVQNLRPMNVTPKVREFLHPRRMMEYVVLDLGKPIAASASMA